MILVCFLAHTTSQDHYKSIRTLPGPNPSRQLRVQNHLLPRVVVVLGVASEHGPPDLGFQFWVV